MPVYYDEKQKSWFCKFYYVDYTGTKKQKKKRGFKLQRDAKEWERNFLERQQADITMHFENFVQLYTEDIKCRIKEVTYIQKDIIIQKKYCRTLVNSLCLILLRPPSGNGKTN